jgi:hypothetical protein
MKYPPVISRRHHAALQILRYYASASALSTFSTIHQFDCVYT